MNTPAKPALPEPADCQQCQGIGTVRCVTSHLGPDDYEFDEECPACAGTGSADLKDAINALAFYKTDPAKVVVEKSAVLRVIEARAAIDAAVTEARGVPERLLQALRFYARGEHYITDDDEEFDTVSGEPDNWLCSGLENSSTMIESGGIARRALLGQTLNWIYDDEDQTPQPIEGEALSATPSPTEPAMLNGLTEDETAATASVAGLSSAEPAMPAERTCVECGGPLQWRCPACRIAQSKDVAAPPQLAEGERAEPIKVFSHGPWTFEETGERFTGAELDGACFVKYKAALDSQAAELEKLRAANANLKTVMVAAAEEIHAHWDAHCDAEGYGPQNLMRRLEEGIPSEYGYTAGRFAELQAELAALRASAASVQADQRDSLRYRIWREHFAGATSCEISGLMIALADSWTPEAVDAAIDAALAAKGEAK